MGPRLWLVRHGESVWNAEGRFQGQADPELSALGRRQAAALSARLFELSPAAVYSSDLRRCVDSVAPLADQLGAEAILEPALREVDVGSWSGLTREEISRQFPGELERWRTGEDFRRGGGESFAELDARVLGAIAKLTASHGPNDEVAVCTHGGWIRSLLGQVLGLSRPLAVLGSPGNGSLTVLRALEDGYRLDSFNDRGHLGSAGDR